MFQIGMLLFMKSPSKKIPIICLVFFLFVPPVLLVWSRSHRRTSSVPSVPSSASSAAKRSARPAEVTAAQTTPRSASVDAESDGERALEVALIPQTRQLDQQLDQLLK